MIDDFKRLLKGGKKALIILICAVVLSGIYPCWNIWQKARADEEGPVLGSNDISNLVILQGNSLDALSIPVNPDPEVVQRIRGVVTAYSSTVGETDDTPFVTAAGTSVRDGVIANNYLPIGTKVRIPELYGDKIFIVEDRMSWQKSNYHFDIWFPDYWQALNFGAKKTYIEILES